MLQARRGSAVSGPARVQTLEAGITARHYWADIWRFRELLAVLAWRDITVRYRQTALGIAWAIFRPLLTMLVFTIVFGRIAKLPGEGSAPYVIMVLTGMLPWFLISTIVADGASSLVSNASLVGKIYFPRMVIPLATTATAVIDLAINLLILAGMMLWFGVVPSWRLLLLPLFIVWGGIVGLGPALALAALNVKYRDFRYIIPFLIQLGLYVSPVGFSSKIVPPGLRLAYNINPVVAIIDGFRWSLLPGASPLYLPGLAISAALTVFLLVVGSAYFRRSERAFADLI